MVNVTTDEVLQKLVENEFQSLSGTVEKPEQLSAALSLFKDYLEWRLFSGFEFAGRIGNTLENYDGGDKVSVLRQLSAFGIKFVNTGRETGRRYDYIDLITPQELALIQSGRGAEGISPQTHPFRPYAFQRFQNVNIVKLRAQRDILGTNEAWAFYYGLGGDFVKTKLEPLNNSDAIRDPTPLDENLQPIQTYTKSANFPFRRD